MSCEPSTQQRRLPLHESRPCPAAHCPNTGFQGRVPLPGPGSAQGLATISASPCTHPAAGPAGTLWQLASCRHRPLPQCPESAHDAGHQEFTNVTGSLAVLPARWGTQGIECQWAAGPLGFKPAPKGFWAFTGRPACKQTVHANVFVQVRPVDAFAIADQLPVRAFRGIGIGQTRELGQGHGDRAAIGQAHDQGIFRQRNRGGPWDLCLGRRSSHVTPPSADPMPSDHPFSVANR